MDRLLSVPEVAALLGVSRAQVYRYVEAGLPCVRLSNRVLRFRPSDLERWVDEQLTQPSDFLLKGIEEHV
jgi:excisionase family DNA binding protein